MNNTNITILFKTIRKQEWKKCLKLLDTIDDYDLNIKDENSNYVLSYAVKYNRPEIVKKIFEKNMRHDIVDESGRSIIYEAVSNNYYEIIKIFLEQSILGVGTYVINIKDLNGNIPLHYAIMFKKIELVKLFLKYNSNLYTTDDNGYTALHLAVKSGDYEIVNIIIKNMKKLNIISLKGETALHIAINYQYYNITKILVDNGADINVKNIENEFTPLHYAVGWENIDIINLLIGKGVDCSIQDIYGNTPIIYAIRENNINCFDIIFNNTEDKKFVNLWNFYGKIVLHEVFDNYTVSHKYYVDKLIKYSNLTTQDANGNTCLHHLIKKNLWFDYIDILKEKRLNVFVRNYENMSVIDMLNIKDYDKFINVIVDSYMFNLKKEGKEWKKELDKICSRNFNELTKDEKEYIGNIKDNNDMYSNCKKLIKNKFIENIEKYNKGELDYCYKSYPNNIGNCVNIEEGLKLDVCTFTGTLLDVLIGLIFIMKKHPKICSVINKNVSNNNTLCNHYKSINKINDFCNFIHFEIIWTNNKMILIDDFINLFNDCRVKDINFILIPIGIEMDNGSHANYLIYDKNSNEIERFEPHGGTVPTGFNYNSTNLDMSLEELFIDIDPKIKYIKPTDYISKVGFQIMDSLEDKKHKIGDPGGFCALWCIWYADNRFTYNTYDRHKLIKYLFTGIKSQNISYKNMIRNYSRNVITIRDNLLSLSNIDINDWINENYTNNQLDTFKGNLINEINKCIQRI